MTASVYLRNCVIDILPSDFLLYLWGMNELIIEKPSARWTDYELIDSGNGEKLERFGPFTMIRPEPKALWDKSMSSDKWRKSANTAFTPGAGFSKSGKEDSGVWNMLKGMPEQWRICYPLNSGGDTAVPESLTLRLGLTAFKHVGVFPEQAPNWEFIYRQVSRLRENFAKKGIHEPPKVLNLFAYTGAASLAAKAAGADVTHLDSVKQVVTWARNNMELSGLDGIRWIIDDALKFVIRQVRRGVTYDGIILDPPAYGRGPDGERWKLDECLNDILKGCAAILSPMNSFLVLNLYSNGYSAMLSDTLVGCAFGKAGNRTSGELVLEDKAGRILPLSVFTRLER